MKKSLGILLTNTGTPDSPAVADVKKYLKTFLSDRRVVRLPRLLWLPLLNAVILPLRAPYSAKLYQNIWTEKGSPLRFNMLELARELEKHLAAQVDHPLFVETGMHYGKPSIPEALANLEAKNITQLVVLPLYPQYSTSTTETTRDQLKPLLEKRPELQSFFIAEYAAHPAYIAALVKQIKKYRDKSQHLLFSFHGLPQAFADQGDPYPDLCQQTARRVAESLALSSKQWSLAYQSRFGYAKWLSPYTFETLEQLPQQGVKQVAVVCPGFSVDCLETLEEIQLRGKEAFLSKGGEEFQYIPALNAQKEQVVALGEIIQSSLHHRL